MASYNRVIMVGNLTRDPDYKQLSSGQAVCRLGIASNRQFKNRQTGTMVQEVCYIDVDVWGAQAESCKQYLQKGRAVLVEGRIKLDTWEDPQGQKRSKHSIVADRVVFLASASMAESSDDLGLQHADSSSTGSMEKELLNQINEVKTRAARKAPAGEPKNASTKDKKRYDAGEIDFSDEPPFEEELPF